LQGRAQKWAASLKSGQVIAGESAVGGGSLPGEILPTFLLALKVPKPDQFLHQLRSGSLPVIARIQADQVVFDPRTILPEQDEPFLGVLSELLRGAQ
jgi:L-seryl-tRNA(Ser) seleniumtransferase